MRRKKPMPGYFIADRIFAQVGRQTPAMDLLFMPSLAGVSRDPDLAGGTGELAMQSICEFNSNDVAFESLIVRYGPHLRPMHPCIR